MTALIFKPYSARHAEWRHSLQRALPDIEIRLYPEEEGDPDDIELALLWDPPVGMLPRYKNLKAILSGAAGVDHLLNVPDLPAHVPIARNADPNMAATIAEYALCHTIGFHRHARAYSEAQQRAEWLILPQKATWERRVGILGFGTIGQVAGRLIARYGFQVAGWSRTAKSVEGIESFAGTEGLEPFLARSDVVVCVLPRTPDTEGILNASAFAAMPEGGFVINVARGDHIVDADLIAALDSGRLAGATLDVFAPEPLSKDSPLWSHPKVVMTPHVAGLSAEHTSVPLFVDNIRRVLAGRPMLHLVDRQLGY
jgi:glyoxylate/hydroxypyruvate reductase A